MTATAQPRQIFISYAPADRAVAEKIGNRLRDSGLRVWFDQWEIAAGDSLVDRINAGIESSDLLLVLLSPDAIVSKWVQFEWTQALSRELDYRAINVIPALVRDCEVPALLANRTYIDLRHNLDLGVERLKHQLGVAVTIDFNRISPRDFEHLIADLLTALGFEVELTAATRDGGIDIIATQKRADPFGGNVLSERWMVQTKLYRDRRVGVEFLREVVGLTQMHKEFDQALVVTTGQLTSVATEYLASLRSRVRVIEGTELRRLLFQYPAVANKYFAPGAS